MHTHVWPRHTSAVCSTRRKKYSDELCRCFYGPVNSVDSHTRPDTTVSHVASRRFASGVNVIRPVTAGSANADGQDTSGSTRNWPAVLRRLLPLTDLYLSLERKRRGAIHKWEHIEMWKGSWFMLCYDVNHLPGLSLRFLASHQLTALYLYRKKHELF